jgi:hypothetical protein
VDVDKGSGGVVDYRLLCMYGAARGTNYEVIYDICTYVHKITSTQCPPKAVDGRRGTVMYICMDK